MEPLVLEPWLRPMVWGGRILGTSFGKTLPDDRRYGESWEVSAHPLHVSVVAEGPLQGTRLTDLAATHAAELYGEWIPADGAFPLLFKLLDCHELLSIQVHPDDERARRLTGGREHFGKTEAWVVLEVASEGRIYAGLKRGVTRADVERNLAAGTLESCLHVFTPKPGDCIFLRSGTVHAVGGGVVMAEIQQSSDATFRLYDWNRPGPDGMMRELHIHESLESIDWSAGPVTPAVGVPFPDGSEGVFGERLVTSRPFLLDRYQATTRLELPTRGSLSIWLVLDGGGALVSADGSYRRVFRRGETVLVPGSSTSLAWEPQGEARSVTLLASSVPRTGAA